MSPKNFDWKNHLHACFNSTQYCSIATFNGEKVWSNPVYFAYDISYNLYFYSMPSSRHMQNIKKKKNIAVSIYSTDQETQGDVQGVQLEGEAYILSDEEVPQALRIYYKRVYPDDNYTIPENKHIGKNAPWKFVKIIPHHIYYFDTKFFGEERQEVPLDAIR